MSGHNDHIVCANTSVSHGRWRTSLHEWSCYATELHRMHKRSNVDCQHVLIQHATAKPHWAVDNIRLALDNSKELTVKNIRYYLTFQLYYWEFSVQMLSSPFIKLLQVSASYMLQHFEQTLTSWKNKPACSLKVETSNKQSSYYVL